MPSPEHPVPSADPLVGLVVADRFRIRSLVARGGMGSVYEAEQVQLGRAVALKLLVPAALRSEDAPELRRRFMREAETNARLRHPNTVTVYDYGVLSLPDGSEGLYIAMEYVHGRTLAKVLKDEGKLSAPRVITIALQIARSLREAHAHGIVHRDLKPGNVMLSQGDEQELVKVLDFGVAKIVGEGADGLTTAGSFVGSPRYASPEQIREAEVDGRADLYSLGVVLYELLTGGPPFVAPDTIRMLMMHLNDTPPPILERAPATPAGLAELVHQLLAKEPAARPEHADALIYALKGLSGTDAVPGTATWAAPKPKPTPKMALFAGLGAGGAMLIAAVLCAGLGFVWRGELLALTQAPEAVVVGPEPVALPPEPTPVVVPTVVIRSNPGGATVFVDGAAVGATPLNIPVDQRGDIELRLSGYSPKRHTLDGTDATVTLARTPPRPKPPDDAIRTAR